MATTTTTHQQAAPAHAPPAPQADPKRLAEEKESRRQSSYGGQVILEYEGDAALGARGGAGGTIEENQMVRDADLMRLGHNPISPSNELLGSPPNFTPGKAVAPKRRAPGVPEPDAAPKHA